MSVIANNKPGSNDFVRFTACPVPYYFEPEDGGYIGHLALLFNSFLQVYPLRFNITMSDDLDYGQLGEDGSATGVIGDIMENRSDISLNPIGAHEMFIKFADLTSIIGFDSWKLIGAELKEKSKLKGSFIFSTDVWISIAVSSMLFYISINIIRLIATKSFFGIKKSWTNNNIIFQELAVLLLQGPSVDSHVLERICWISWIIPSAFITWACSSSLLSTLTLPVMPQVHETFQDILDTQNVQLLILDNTPASLEMQSSLDPIVQQMLKRSKENNLLIRYEEVDMLEMLDETSKGVKVLLLPYDVLMEGINKFGMCESVQGIRVPDTTVFKTYYVYLIRKGIDKRIADAFTSIVYAVIESGIFTQSKAREVSKGSICIPKLEAKETIEVLSIGKIVIPFWILLIGVIISTAALIFEFKIEKKLPLVRHLREKRQKRRRIRFMYISRALKPFLSRGARRSLF